MSNRTCKDLVNKGNVDITLQLNTEAVAKMKAGERVINGTIGMLFDDDGKLVTPDFINDYLEKSFTLSAKRYGSSTGDKKAQESMFKWAVGEYYDDLNKKNYHHGLCFTPGGSGALTLAFRTYASLGDTILLPSICWVNYTQMINQRNCQYEFYNFYNKEGKFDIDDLCARAESLLKAQGNVLILINDPCENPTGYSLSKDEWLHLMHSLNKLVNLGNITLLLDTAYIDVATTNSRLYYSLIDELDSSILTLVVSSSSKTLGLYGLRGGNLFAISKSEDEIALFNKVTSDGARAIWSAVNVPLLNSLSLAYNDENRKILEHHVESIRSIIEVRSNLMLKLLKENNIDHLPYSAGFFIVIPTTDCQVIAAKLREKNVYVLPIQGNYIRIALCSLKTNDIPDLVKALKECL